MSKVESFAGLSRVNVEGRVLIPKDIRDSMGISTGEDVRIEYRDGVLIISKPVEADGKETETE